MPPSARFGDAAGLPGVDDAEADGESEAAAA